MKYLKTYENLTIEPKVGDYVLMRVNLELYKDKDEVNDFVNNTIGQIIEIHKDEEIRIRYDNVPDNIKDWFLNERHKGEKTYSRILSKKNIVAIGETPEDVKFNKVINKYNL